MPRELWTPYGYHSAPPPVDPGGVTPITTNQQGVAMMAPHGYISAAPSPVYPAYYGGWEQCRWVGPFRPSPLFPPPGVCTMVQAWLVLSTRLWLLCRVLIHRPGLWVHLGPLSKTPRGNTVILMLIDQFTKWIECYPLPDQSAEVVAKAIVEDFFSRFGVPREIHTDQGRNFVSNLFTSLCSLLQVRKTQTTGYRPCSNCQIERMNQQVLQMLRCLREKNIRDWDTSLSQIDGAIQSTVNRSTGFTPNKLMLAREVNKPVDVLFGVNRANTTLLTPPEYVAHVDKTIKASHGAARGNLGASILYIKGIMIFAHIKLPMM